MSAIHSEYISKLFLFDFDRKPENIPTPETLLCSLYRQLELSSLIFNLFPNDPQEYVTMDSL